MTDSVNEFVNRRILVIDDNPAIHQDFEKVLRPGVVPDAAMSEMEKILFGDRTASVLPAYQIDFALQGQHGVVLAASAAASERPFAMAFIDMRMPPGWDGLETIEHLWAADPDIQVVICSAHSDYDWSDLVERLGHSDKLLVLKKPFEAIEVMQCASALTRKWQQDKVLRHYVGSLEKVVSARTDRLEAANRQLRHMATHDALTGLPNRTLLEDRLVQAMVHADRNREQFAVLVLDLDRFKLVNDSLGHRAGDELLNEVARRLTTVVRTIDTVARVGGDEFVLVLSPDCDRQNAESIGQRALEVFRTSVLICGIDLYISPSIGVAFYPRDGKSAEALIARADAAMYYAKQRGRNNLQFFTPGMDVPTRERVKLESDLRNALALQQFELHYQAKVDTVTSSVNSAEVLICWHHPEHGILLPEKFIPLAEESGLVGPIGEWVMREACRQCKRWQRDGLQPMRVAVNVAASQFRLGNLLDMIRSALDDAELEPRYLEIEIAESTVMTNPEESAGILEQLSRMGVLVSVDDFGTGYSSMSYLRRFPIDKLKIDQSFVKALMTRTEDASIVQAIISLAHSLRLKVVAEGVESAEQLDFLKSMGCDQYQGYHFSQPVPAAAFEKLVRGMEQKEWLSFSDEDALRTHSKLAGYRKRE